MNGVRLLFAFTASQSSNTFKRSRQSEADAVLAWAEHTTPANNIITPSLSNSIAMQNAISWQQSESSYRLSFEIRINFQPLAAPPSRSPSMTCGDEAC
jgi:hypothetical protein